MRKKYGVGINDKPDYWDSKEYRLWDDMLRRCYSDLYQAKKPTYIGCEVSENFKSYSYFYTWCHKQVGFGVAGFHLDKDLLIKGNKFYSEDTCVFVPKEINALILKCDKSRGVNPIGVTFHKRIRKYAAKINHNAKRVHIGYYDDPVVAFNAYKKEKERHIKNVANKYIESIDPRAYEALMQYTVEITD